MLPRQNNTQIVLFSLAAVVSFSFFFYWFRASTAQEVASSKKAHKSSSSSNASTSSNTTSKSATASVTSKQDEKALHAKIEELDRKGKAYFKGKQYLDAAQAFTDALNLIQSADTSTSLQRQAITLLNNRSAMYEKANMPELALEDCNSILESEVDHTKARGRKIRLLEDLERNQEALVQVCAMQLLHMRANRTNLRMGLPVPPPPVPHTKLEELLMSILPEQMEPYVKELEAQDASNKRPLPSNYTIVQLLKSYAGYNAWMAEAAKSGSAASMEIPAAHGGNNDDLAERAYALYKRGLRYVYQSQYELATKDFEDAYKIVYNNPYIQDAMPDDSHARLLEWTGMVRHWHYNLEGSMLAYRACANVEPMNALVLVKQAGVQMDKGEHEEAVKLFDKALDIDPNTVDALLHRSNLRMLQGKPEEAKADLIKCLELRPNHVMARLRLASIYAAMDDAEAANQQLDLAENEDPKSSDVQSHRGELYFTQGKMEEAREQFEKAMELEPSNPTPYVNCAMAILNTPVAQGQLPDTAAVMDYLERAIEVDPQFTAAYMQLGQLALGTATDLTAAKEVIKLYDNGLANCRTKEEIKELVSMRVLAVAQVDAASLLGMETFSMQ